MRLLLDTHALIWSAMDGLEGRLSSRARDAIEDRSNSLIVSAASAWEIATKHRRGRLPDVEHFVTNWHDVVVAIGATDLDITSRHSLRAGSFPVDHRDPFDRLLAAQAEIERATLVTADRALDQFGVDILW